MEYVKTHEEKQDILHSLLAMQRQGQLAEIDLRLQNEKAQADKVWECTTRLSAEIDILIGRMMDEWLEMASTATQQLVDATSNIATVIADIKKKKQIASDVVKVLGYLDEAVDVAKKLAVAV